MDLKTDRQFTLIVNNVVKACKDISKLNKTGYDFLYLASGFIAHYNLHGFKRYYFRDNLKATILQNQNYNQYQNFTPKDKDYEYYMQQRNIYNAICELIGD